MAKRKVMDVQPNKRESGWHVSERGGSVSYHPTKAAAVKQAKREAKSAELGQVVIRTRDGEIQTEYTYGDDPRLGRG